jgi:hypothetical protein
MIPIETSDLLARLKAAAFPGVDASALPERFQVRILLNYMNIAVSVNVLTISK